MLAALLQPGEILEHHFQVLGIHGFLDESTHFQVLLHGHLQENPASLRHLSQALGQQLAGIGVGDVFVTEGDGALAGVHQAGDGFQDGALACAVGADQGHDLSFVDFKGNALDGVDGAVIHMNVVNSQHAHSASSLPR